MYLSFHAAKGGKSFVGIEYTCNSIDFYYPETYSWDAGNIKGKSYALNDPSFSIYDHFGRSILDLLNCLSLAKYKATPEEINNLYDSGNGEFSLLAYRWLIQDFLNNGIYNTRSLRYKSNCGGRVNWKRTMQGIPIINSDSVVYPNLVEYSSQSSSNIITEIYTFCLKKSLFLIGWLYNIDRKLFPVHSIDELTLTNEKKNLYLYALKKELASTFHDKKKDLLNNLYSIVVGMNVSDSGHLRYGVNEFDKVFEKMIYKIWNTEDIHDYEPKGIYEDIVGHVSCYSSSLEPDAILHPNSNDYYIIDAKCYRFFLEGYVNTPRTFEGLPATDSIQKQITYGDEIATMDPPNRDNIRNCFMLPFTKTKDQKYLIDTNVVARAGWRNSITSYDTIKVLFVDMRYLVENYSANTHSKEQADLALLI